MKKITLLFTFLITSFGFSQQVLIEDFEGSTPVEGFGGVTTSVEAAPSGSNGNSLKIVAVAGGQVWQGGKFTLPTADIDFTTDKTAKVDIYSTTAFTIMGKAEGAGVPASADLEQHTGSGWETITFTFTTGADGTGTANGVYNLMAFFPFRKSDDSGWNTPTDFTFFVDNIKSEKVAANDPADDATLSDLKVDGNTIAGFDSGTLDYEYLVAPGTTTVPTVTATTTQGVATTMITAAGSIPGDTTVKVTSGNTNNTKTYKVSFKFEVAPTDAPSTPPTFAANNVISFYSESYTSTGLNGVSWDNGSESTEETYAGNKVLKITSTGGDFIGFDVANTDGFVNATSMTHVHVDFWVAGDYVAGQVLKIKLSNHGNGTSETSAIIKEIALPATDTKKWVSLDLPLEGGARERIAQILLIHTNSTGGVSTLYADNIYMYVDGTANTENNKVLGFAMYPNPAKNQLTISAKESISKAEVFNVLGRKVKSFAINSTNKTLDISNLSSGVYLIKYESAGKVGTAKFIKQ